MSQHEMNSGEILFVKCVKDGIPNRDPLRDSDARRIFDPEDGRISLSDVSIKRDVRDFILARHPDGGPDKNLFIFCRPERDEKSQKLLGRKALAEKILEQANVAENVSNRDAMMRSAFDVRVFGAVFSVKNKKENFNQCGPVQFGWAHSLHPVETIYTQGTVVMPSKDIAISDKGEEEGASQGTIWTMYTLPFAVFAMPAVINASIARETGMTGEDTELLIEALWKGTQHRQARGRGFQQPLFLLHIEYADPFDRIGYLEDMIRLDNTSPKSLADFSLDITGLVSTISKNRTKIVRVRYARYPSLRLLGSFPEDVGVFPTLQE